MAVIGEPSGQGVAGVLDLAERVDAVRGVALAPRARSWVKWPPLTSIAASPTPG